MKITRVGNGLPPDAPSPESSAPGVGQTPAPDPVPASGLPSVSRAELHSPHQPAILQRSLMALLDRASEGMAALPSPSREMCAEMLAADPYLTARLLNYLEQKAH